jgi:hypothetical protein
MFSILIKCGVATVIERTNQFWKSHYDEIKLGVNANILEPPVHGTFTVL